MKSWVSIFSGEDQCYTALRLAPHTLNVRAIKHKMDNSISKEEAFQTSYRAFINAVEILSQSPETQCNLLGNYNVAWELKDEIISGKYLYENPESNITEEQIFSIRQLVEEIRKIPESVLVEAKTKSKNLISMNHPCWKPLRKHAALLIRSLKSVTERNEAYFK